MAENNDFSEQEVEAFKQIELKQKGLRNKFIEMQKLGSTSRHLSWDSLRESPEIEDGFYEAISYFQRDDSETKPKSVKSDLDKFPKPSLAVDVAVLSVIEVVDTHRLIAFAIQRGAGPEEGTWSLPGRMVRERETLEQTALEALRIKLGIEGVKVEQLRVFDNPDRDPRGWVMSVAHIATISSELAFVALGHPDVAPILIDGEGITLPDNQLDLPFEQMQILREAVKELRRTYSLLPDPGHILEDEFTLLQLREVHEAIHDEEIAPDTFRREMLPNLKPTGHRQEGFVGKPPMMYRRRERKESKVRASRSIASKMIDADEFL